MLRRIFIRHNSELVRGQILTCMVIGEWWKVSADRRYCCKREAVHPDSCLDENSSASVETA